MWYRDHIGIWGTVMAVLVSGQIRVCLAACQNLVYSLKLEVERHCILTRNQASGYRLKIELGII